MSGMKGSTNDSRCTSGSSGKYQTKLVQENSVQGITGTILESEISHHSLRDQCDYNSKYSDSGVWSGSNIQSEEMPIQDLHDIPKPSEFTFKDMTRSEKVPCELETSNCTRLDSGIDVSQHLSELSLKDNYSYNDLSIRHARIDSPKNTVPDLPTGNLKLADPPSLLDCCFKQNEDGDTNLHLAIVHNFIETVFALVRLVPSPAYLNIKNYDCQTPLHLAVLTQQPKLVRLLVSAGAALDQVDRNGNTALHLAVEACDLPCVQALISPVTVPEMVKAQLQYSLCFPNKVIADIHNYEGVTCLHLAAMSGNLNIFKHLQWSGADVDAKEWKGGRTCLHLAVERRDLDLSTYLVIEGTVNVEATDYAGYTAYQSACCGGWDLAIADMLRQHGVDTYLSDSDSESDSDSDKDMLEVKYCGGGGLVDVGA